MAGHNKWSKIKHRKAVVDKRRGKAWSMCSRAIISAARQGGPDPNFNFALRTAMDEARYHNVPADNIDRAIKKGVGGGAGDDYEPVRYEGYGPGGVAVIIDAFTNNRARTAGDVRLLLGDHGGKLGATGCVSHQFEHRGQIIVRAAAREEDAVIEAALGAGALDVRPGEDEEPGFVVLTDPTQLGTVKDALSRGGLALGESGLEMIPTTTTTVAGQAARELLRLVEALEDNEDVKRVFTNADIPDADLAAMQE
ncbi:MAG: YebC/PmpR family DNA-binding transcriptional regulator [Phycisphaerales bacterium]